MNNLQINKNDVTFYVNGSNEYTKWWDECINHNTWEPYTYSIIDYFANNNNTYIDIGAWIGTTVLYAAQKFSKVVTFEPDSVAYNELISNININKYKNIIVEKLAVGSKDCNKNIYSGSVEGKLGWSNSTLLKEEGQSVECKCITLEKYIKENNIKFNDIGLIKIDTEGGENDIIPNILPLLKEFKIPLYISFHPHIVDISYCKDLLVKNCKTILNKDLIEIEDITDNEVVFIF